MASSSFVPKAAASALGRRIARSRMVRKIKARLDGLVDAVAGWLDPGCPDMVLQPVRVRGARGGERGRH